MVIKNPRKQNGTNVSQEDIDAYNKAMANVYGQAYSGLQKTRGTDVMSSGSGLAGIVSGSDYAKRQSDIAKQNEKTLAELEKERKAQQSSALAAARNAADMAWEREKRQWERQDRQWTMQDRATQQRLAEEERQRQAEALARQGTAYRSIADLYKTQGEESYTTALKNIAAMYGGEETAMTDVRKRQLDALTKALGESRGQIGAAEQQALSSLISPTAYQNVPLVNLAPQQQVLQAALAAEGTGASQQQVSEQNYAQQLASQFNELAKRSAEQLNVGETNYLTALRNALTGGALAARTGVEQRGAAITGGIEEQYAAAMRDLARQRAAEQAQVDAERRAALLRAAEAAAQAEAFSPAPVAPEKPKEEEPVVTPDEEARRKAALERLAQGILRGEFQAFA